MDHKRMDKRGYRRGPGAPKRPKHKVYGVLAKEGFVYFPIAAVWAPYIINGGRPESYLAGMPNFFGGNKNVQDGVWEDDYTALAREIREESQGKIELMIPQGALETLFSCDQKDGNTYRFYLVRTERCTIQCFDLEGETVCPLRTYEQDLENASEDYIRENQCRYEDSFLVGMEEERFCGLVQRLLALKDIEDLEARKEQVESMLQNGYHISGGATTKGVNNWYDSHTAEAFSFLKSEYQI